MAAIPALSLTAGLLNTSLQLAIDVSKSFQNRKKVNLIEGDYVNPKKAPAEVDHHHVTVAFYRVARSSFPVLTLRIGVAPDPKPRTQQMQNIVTNIVTHLDAENEKTAKQNRQIDTYNYGVRLEVAYIARRLEQLGAVASVGPPFANDELANLPQFVEPPSIERAVYTKSRQVLAAVGDIAAAADADVKIKDLDELVANVQTLLSLMQQVALLSRNDELQITDPAPGAANTASVNETFRKTLRLSLQLGRDLESSIKQWQAAVRVVLDAATEEKTKKPTDATAIDAHKLAAIEKASVDSKLAHVQSTLAHMLSTEQTFLNLPMSVHLPSLPVASPTTASANVNNTALIAALHARLDKLKPLDRLQTHKHKVGDKDNMPYIRSWMLARLVESNELDTLKPLFAGLPLRYDKFKRILSDWTAVLKQKGFGISTVPQTDADTDDVPSIGWYCCGGCLSPCFSSQTRHRLRYVISSVPLTPLNSLDKIAVALTKEATGETALPLSALANGLSTDLVNYITTFNNDKMAKQLSDLKHQDVLMKSIGNNAITTALLQGIQRNPSTGTPFPIQ